MNTLTPTRWARAALVVAAGLLATACAPEIGGRASFPILSRGQLAGYEKIADVDEQRCLHYALLVGWGDDANHEALISDILQRHQGDAIVNAELTFHVIPAFLYNRTCAVVEGTVVRRTGGGAPPPAEPPPPPATTPEVTQ